MIVEILQMMVGTLAVLFSPGYLIMLLFFEEVKGLERYAFAVALSLMTTILIGIFLGYNAEQAAWTGGVNFIPILICELVIHFVLLSGLGVKFYLRKRAR